MSAPKLALWGAAVLGIALGARGAKSPVAVGSKKFTESYVLAEIAAGKLERAGYPAVHRPGMGGTIILWRALREGAISVYPEYTGTISEEILRAPRALSRQEMREALRRLGIGMTRSLGFDDTYALVMRADRAAKLGIRTISDLAAHPELVLGLTHEFLGRSDGWGPLSARYGLRMGDVRGVDHAIGYSALAAGEVDVKDAYSTDARIARDGLTVLEDDRRFFPEYRAVYLYRRDLDPGAVEALRGVEGTISAARMTELNAEAERKKSYSAAAAAFFGARSGSGRGGSPALLSRIGRWTLRHLELVGLSMLFAVGIGVPLGIRASRPGPAASFILGAAGVIQTMPALALLALLVPVPFLGIGPATAIVALFLYSLLPIVRSTAAGIQSIPAPLFESAEALGLSPGYRLRHISLPLASRSILSGIKTSAVINVGAATLAALIGAGGLGEPIVSGLNLNDNATILEGAVPAALLALAVQAAFAGLDRLLIPRGLRGDVPSAR